MARLPRFVIPGQPQNVMKVKRSKPIKFKGLVVVMETASDNHELSIGCPVHQSVRVINAPGPVAG